MALINGGRAVEANDYLSILCFQNLESYFQLLGDVKTSSVTTRQVVLLEEGEKKKVNPSFQQRRTRNFSAGQSYLHLPIIYIACRDLLQPFDHVPKFIMIKSFVS
ncbi:hypothetical protein POM88_023931 [Heracleum sosnowskyi]|uniref:Uncharacterized protein n=1 Tax=Heracleum sosnowskyi TaxID=360622 RepID=A0AAD8IIJ4_9APIA|nr:hypothetical protein POM88_023931 [Heracleum sosnowskyi]